MAVPAVWTTAKQCATSAAPVERASDCAGDDRHRGQHRLAPSDARSERQQPTRLGGGQRRLDQMLHGGRLGRPHGSHDGAAAEDQEEVSPVRAHPLAAGMRRPGLRQPGRTAHAAAGVTVQAQQPAKRPRLQPAQWAADAADASGRVLQELPLPARNSGSGSSPAPQRPEKRTERTGAAAQGGAVAAEPGAAAGAELARGFGDLSHMRHFAVEASKALDGLRRQQRRTPAKGARPAAIAGAGGGSGSPGGGAAARGRDGQRAATAAAARATIEKFKRQLARPPGRTPPKAGHDGAGEAAAAEPADAAAASEAAELPGIAAATPVRPPHSRGTPGMRRSSFYDEASDDIFSQLSSPRLPRRRADDRYAMRDSLVPESPNISLQHLSGSQPLSQADRQQWRLLSGGSPARPAVSDPSPGLRRRQPHRDLSQSPGRRQRRRLSVGALSDGWLSDPSDEEADLLAADGFLAQSPLQSPCQSSPFSSGLADAGGAQQEMAEDRLFALARGSGRLRRRSSEALGLAGIEGFNSFAGESLAAHACPFAELMHQVCVYVFLCVCGVGRGEISICLA